MKRSVLAALAASVFLASVALVAAQKQDFTLVNKTGLQIDKVFVSPSKVDTWGDDILGRDVLGDGEKVDIKFGHSATACHYDLKIVDAEKDSVVWEDINLCECDVLTLKYEGKHATMDCKAPTSSVSR
jgi:hypothetical protein